MEMAAKELELDANDGTCSKCSRRWTKFRQFMYNRDEGTVMQRTAKGWLQILTFYLCFYAILAGVFAITLHLFLSTLDTKSPKWIEKDSLLGLVPGMSFRPVPPVPTSTFVWINRSNSQLNSLATPPITTYQHYSDSLRKFFDPYNQSQQTTENFVQCSSTVNPTSTDGNWSDNRVCKFDVRQLGPCNPEMQKNFGFDQGRACVLLKINKMFGWKPAPYNTDVDNPSSATLPTDIATFYQNILGLPFTYDPSKVYVTCGGVTPSDDEHIGKISLHPPYFSTYFFPFTNSPGYLAPLVMVFFQRPHLGVVINVQCRFWASNVKADTVQRLAYVQFELLVNK